MQRGFSLIELMLGLTVSLMILAGVLTLYTQISFSGVENIRSMHLNQQLRSGLDRMHRDLQRAGYVQLWPAGKVISAGFKHDAIELFGRITLGGICDDTDGDGASECSCISYSYDLNDDGEKNPVGESLGFRLHKGALESGKSIADCEGGGTWRDMNDGEVKINRLSFELDPLSNIAHEIDGDGDGVCESGEVCSAKRKINIIFNGELFAKKKGPLYQGIRLYLRDEVKLKNDHYFTAP